MPEASEHAVFVLPTREDVAAIESGRNPGNVLWREFDTAPELVAYAAGIEAVEDEFDEIDVLERKGRVVVVGRSEGSERHEFETEGQAEAFRQGIEDSEGFHAPLLIGRDDPRFAKLADLGHPAAAPGPNP